MNYIEFVEKHRRRGSLKTRMIYFVIFILLLFLILIFTYNRSHYNLVDNYDQSFGLHEELIDFYSNCYDFHVAFKGFLPRKEEAYYEVYQRYYNSAKENLMALEEVESFRFGLLENMIITYNEKVEEAIVETNATKKQTLYDTQERLYTLIMDTQPDSYGLLTKYSIKNKNRLVKEVENQLTRSIIMTVLIIMVSSILIYTTMKDVIKPLGILVNNANKIKQGNFEVEPVIKATEETEVLSEAFNKMVIAIQEHVESVRDQTRLEKRIIKQENENLRMAKVIAETKLSIVQKQMNAHFLFNTLSIISKLAYIEGAERTSELMVITSELLRYSVEKGGKTSTLSEEIVSCENYVRIQKERFGDRIHFEMLIDPVLPNINIPAMLIQPIIENAVIHGVEDMIEGACIQIAIASNNGHIYISVTDNGAGMAAEKLENHMMGIGIRNVKTRLRMLYKDNCMFSIDSKLHQGTQVKMVLPNNYFENRKGVTYV